MAMTGTEARAVTALVEWVTAPAGTEATGDAARSALVYLADRARKTLAAGPGGQQVREAWPAPGRPRGARNAALTDQTWS